MADEAKAAIIGRLLDQGYTTSYGTLIHLTALMGPDPEALEPQDDEERYEWRGHYKGLRAALACLAMHEKAVGPESAAALVGHHVTEAITELGQHGGPR
jgi:hypothetical protein